MTAFSAEIFGARTRPFTVHNEVPMWKLRFRLRPGVAPLLLGHSAREITDGAVPLDDPARADGRTLLDALDEANDPDVRLERARRGLLARLQSLAADDDRWTQARALAAHVDAKQGRLRVRDLCDETGFGERRLERLFRDTLGVTPKLYIQLARFGAARRSLSAGGRGAEVALAHGYADQPHLVREFVRFAGASPSRLQ